MEGTSEPSEVPINAWLRENESAKEDVKELCERYWKVRRG